MYFKKFYEGISAPRYCMCLFRNTTAMLQLKEILLEKRKIVNERQFFGFRILYGIGQWQ
jgi:hypothetical protein